MTKILRSQKFIVYLCKESQKFLVDRENANKHLAFGAGQHLCLGNQLGKMQIRVLFEELLKAYPNMHSVSEPVRVSSNFLDAISDLQVNS